ncbi:MAG: hypothetical protein QXW98_06750 [Candidatus Caldarchaeum sp.]
MKVFLLSQPIDNKKGSNFCCHILAGTTFSSDFVMYVGAGDEFLLKGLPDSIFENLVFTLWRGGESSDKIYATMLYYDKPQMKSPSIFTDRK